MNLTPTPSQTVGPYLHLGLTDARSISRIAGDQAKGERVWLRFRVLDGDGVPVPDAMIELWQADAEGNYAHQDSIADEAVFRGFGRLATSEDGSCTFETIRPGCVAGPGDAVQAPHPVRPKPETPNRGPRRWHASRESAPAFRGRTIRLRPLGCRPFSKECATRLRAAADSQPAGKLRRPFPKILKLQFPSADQIPPRTVPQLNPRL